VVRSKPLKNHSKRATAKISASRRLVFKASCLCSVVNICLAVYAQVSGPVYSVLNPAVIVNANIWYCATHIFWHLQRQSNGVFHFKRLTNLYCKCDAAHKRHKWLCTESIFFPSGACTAVEPTQNSSRKLGKGLFQQLC
jgi:hypothetical protein